MNKKKVDALIKDCWKAVEKATLKGSSYPGEYAIVRIIEDGRIKKMRDLKKILQKTGLASLEKSAGPKTYRFTLTPSPNVQAKIGYEEALAIANVLRKYGFFAGVHTFIVDEMCYPRENKRSSKSVSTKKPLFEARAEKRGLDGVELYEVLDALRESNITDVVIIGEDKDGLIVYDGRTTMKGEVKKPKVWGKDIDWKDLEKIMKERE